MKSTIDSFLDYLRFEKRYSIHTVTSYENDLRGFQNFMLITYQFDSVALIKHIHVRSWIVLMMQEKYTPKSINRKISTLKSYFKFLRRSKIVSKNPMLKIISPKIGKRLPEYVQESNIKKLLDTTSQNLEYSEWRNILLVELLYLTGMRRAELINLKITDFDALNKSVKVLGKGNKERIIPVSKQYCDKLTKFLSDQPFENCDPYVFLTDKGKKMYDKLVYNIVRQVLNTITSAKKKSPHILRHSFATHLSNNGAELNAIKELLGHANLAATQVYTHNSIEKLKSVYKAAHPKA